MKIWLSKSKKEQIDAIERYAKKNDKLLALRDKNSKILGLGLSIYSLTTITSKDGFKYYQVITKERQMETSSVSEEVRLNNYILNYPIHDVTIEIYEGKKNHNNAFLNKVELYWYKRFQYYCKYPEKFYPHELINKLKK